MKNLAVNYLGLKLKNPVIAGSSGLTSTVAGIKKLEEAGAAAVVLKSLFEEQIDIEISAANQYSDYPEAADYVAEYTRQNTLAKYIDLVSSAKKECDIPIIASICCVTKGEWVSFAKNIEEAGADALELNIFILPTDIDESGGEIEKRYLDIVSAVCKAVSIPVAVKIGQNFTNIPAIVKEIYYRGAKGVVMFNRFYEPDINPDTLEVTAADVLSDPSEFRNILRWTALVSSLVPEIDYASTTGIYDGENALKAILAGSATVEVCSAIYRNGNGVIEEILYYLQKWMKEHHVTDLSTVKGEMNYGRISNPLAYERTQFMRYFHSFDK